MADITQDTNVVIFLVTKKRKFECKKVQTFIPILFLLAKNSKKNCFLF